MAYPFRPIKNKINKSKSDGIRKNIARLKLIKKRTAVRFSSKQTEPDFVRSRPETSSIEPFQP